jgi:hypothetical protein
MVVNREKLAELLNSYCGGNYNRFARELGVDPSHLYRFLKTGVGGGKKIAGAVIRFCSDRGIDFQNYIEL